MTNPNFQPMGDLILVLPDPRQDKDGSIVIPEGVTPQGHKPGEKKGADRDTFIGTVVAVGPGDRHKPFTSLKCKVCHKKHTYDAFMDSYGCDCSPCHTSREAVERWDAGHHAMHVKPGDRVVFPRRPSAPGGDCDLKIDGVLYVIFNEEQNAYGVIEA